MNNLGTFTKSGSATTSTISTTFNNTGTVGVPNSGTVNVQSGTLNLSGGGTDVRASYTGAGTIQFGGGIRTLDAASSITGNALFSGGTTTLNGGAGTGLMTVSGGTATFNGTVTTGALTQSSGLLNGTGTFTVSGLSTLSGGRESGAGTTIALGGAAFSTTSFSLDGGRTLQLGGTSTAIGTDVRIFLNGGTLRSWLWHFDDREWRDLQRPDHQQRAQHLTRVKVAPTTGSSAVVNNLGTFTKSGSATTSTISTTFNNTGTVGVPNSGTVNVQSGTLNLSGGGTDVRASYTGAGTVQFGGGTRTLDVASSITAANTPSAVVRRRSMAPSSLRDAHCQWRHLDFAGRRQRWRTDPIRRISQRCWDPDGIWPVDVVGRPGERGGNDDCAGRGGVLYDYFLAGRWPDPAVGRDQHGNRDRCPDFLERRNGDPGSGILTIANDAIFDDQTTSSGLSIFTQGQGGTDDGSSAVVNNLGTFTKSGTAATSTISTTFNNSDTVYVKSGTLTFTGAFSNSGILIADGGNIRIDTAVNDSGSATIFGTSLIQYGAASNDDVTFAVGATGTLILINSSAYTGHVSGFTGTGNGNPATSDKIDLRDISFAAHTESYSNNVLTISDGVDTAHINFVGNYELANFHFSNDGFGGTLVTDPPVGGTDQETFAAQNDGPYQPAAAVSALATVMRPSRQ